MPKFVVHEHWASTHHFDFRIEVDGVLKSWAVPKGVPESYGLRRLAIKVEDHPLKYGDYEGEIPEGEYGAGRVIIWDRGEYELIKKKEGQIKFRLKGDRLHGAYQLLKFKTRNGKEQWLIMKWREKI